MKQSNKIGGIAQKIISTVFFLVTFICLLYLYITVKYLPFFLAAIIVIMPVAVNIFLHLFACKIPSKKPDVTFAQALFAPFMAVKKPILFSFPHNDNGLQLVTVYNICHPEFEIKKIICRLATLLSCINCHKGSDGRFSVIEANLEFYPLACCANRVDAFYVGFCKYVCIF